MWPASFQALVEAQFNVNGFNLPYHDARALECTYTEQNNRCVDNYRLRYIFHRIIYIDSFILHKSVNHKDIDICKSVGK